SRSGSLLAVFSAAPRPSRSTLFPYTTLFRSHPLRLCGLARRMETLCRIQSSGGPRGHVEQFRGVGRRRARRESGRRLRRNGYLQDRKSTRLNSSHEWSSYAVFCLKKKTQRIRLLNNSCFSCDITPPAKRTLLQYRISPPPDSSSFTGFTKRFSYSRSTANSRSARI